MHSLILFKPRTGCTLIGQGVVAVTCSQVIGILEAANIPSDILAV